tara:strand:- start:2500 stop:3159 length:660 start_codon:yes stop_codon:yes gene_type:complete
MKVAIIGAYGFLGTHLTEYYENKGNSVVKIGRDNSKLNNIFDCDFLIHCAGVNRAITPEIVFQENINITEKLVFNLNKLNIKIPIKFISSIHEGNDTPYGKAKKQCKDIMNQYCVNNKVIFENYKLPNLFGTKGKPNYNSFVNTFAYNIVNNIKSQYNTNPVSLCSVLDAIKVIDNQKNKYKLYHTNVKEVYDKLNNIGNSEFDKKLSEILDYYKNIKQ